MRNLLILLWKNLLMRKNHYIATTAELIIPIALIILANVSLPKNIPDVNNDLLVFNELNSGKCNYRHSHYENVIYEPSTPFTNDLMKVAACYAGYKTSSLKPGGLDNMTSLFSLGIYFELSENSSKIPEKLNYTIYPTSEVWINLNNLWRQSDVSVPRYSIPILRNVIELQRAIDISFMDLKHIPSSKINFENTDLYERSPRIFSIVIYLALILSFSLMVPPILGRVVQEKYTGAKELMLMMGVKKFELWLSKFLDSFFFLFISVSGMLIFLYVPLKESSNVLTVPFYIFWGIVMYGLISIILFLFFLSCFFEKANLAVYISEVIWCFTFLLSSYITTLPNLPSVIKYLTYLFPHVTLMNGLFTLLAFDNFGKEVRLTEDISDEDKYSTLLDTLLYMTINIVLYSILTWYLEQVKPGKFGVPKPYGFCFMKSYWVPEKTDFSSAGDHCNNELTPPGYEPVPGDLRKGISIQGVSKVFKSLDKGPVVAVDDVSIDFYHSEISALLGHNGAGKTTMFSMITGLVTPTSGGIFINGYNLSLNTNEARRSLGLCPQKDMLFDDLTVLQILKFYGVIKGLTVANADKETQELVAKLKLEKVGNTQTSNLSGGQKRKVSLAIALIGGSQVLVLDEPTSGMDPEIRREIWEMLLGFRGTRTILLTTHFMEEADALCDRIAIMDAGKIRCYGSSMYLKSKYGKGYVLSIVVNDVGQCNEITEEIKRFVPSATFKSQNIRTVSYELPESEVAHFPALLRDLDVKQAHNEIVSYGISVASLEDVFLKLRTKHEDSNGFDVTDNSHYVKFLSPVDKSTMKVTGCGFYCYQYWALLIKKLIFFQRQWKLFLMYMVLAGALIVVSTLLSSSNPNNKRPDSQSNAAPIVFSPALYSPFLTLFSNPANITEVQSFPVFMQSLGSEVREVPNIKKEISNIFKRDFHEYSSYVNLGIQFDVNKTKVYHNDRAIHMIPVALNTLHNFWLKVHNPSDSIVTSISIKHVRKNQLFTSRFTTKCVLPDIPDFTGSQTFFYFLAPLKEAISGAKEIQLMMTPTVLYWFSHLLFDTVTLVVFLIIVCLWFALYQESQSFVENAGDVVLILLLWGIGMILVAYVISTIFKTETGAFSTSILIYVIFTFVLNNPFSTFGLPTYVLYFHPTSILKPGFSSICNGGVENNNTILSLFLYDLVLFSFLVIKDSNILSQIFHSLINMIVKVDYANQSEDELVEKEKMLVENLVMQKKTSGFALIVSDLKKWYLKAFKPSPTVRGISFTVKEGECFGLLGVNGAGKTSTFRMLTGSLPSSQGKTYLNSETLTIFNRQKYLFQIGYCPQSGGLIPVLKGRELLWFFARLRGIKREYLHEEVEKLLKKLDLLTFANQKCGTYSGGNQRKLSTAIALIGDSPLVFLDEPTSGVDPGSRRLMWNVIDDVQKQGQSVILTSHCMDECEALCSRLAIMVNGRFRCLGEITTLKKRFGQGYSVQLKVSCGTPEDSIATLKSSFVVTFKSECTLIDEHLTILQYHVTNAHTSWAELFAKLKALKDEFYFLESYTASETTLEQIFIYLARNQ